MKQLHSDQGLRSLRSDCAPRWSEAISRAGLAAVVAGAIAGLLSACGSNEFAIMPQADAATADAATADASDAGSPCAAEPIDLLVEVSGGYPSRLHVPITYEGGPAVLLFDTGSNRTFLDVPLGSPDPVVDAGTIGLGCRTMDVIGRPVVPDAPVGGVPSVGTAGTDLILKMPSKIDFAAHALSFHAPGSPFGEAVDWPSAAYDVVQGLVLAHVTIDGQAVRLMADTGSQDTLLLGAQPKPGDREVDTTDALGNPLKLYLGTADLLVGSKHVTIPVLRAPSFPYFEQTVQALGGNIQGLFGLSSMGTQAVVVDTDARRLRLSL